MSNDNPNLRPGLVLKGYPNALAVVERIRRGPYPIDLEFYSLDSLATTQLVEGGTKTATQAPVADNNTYVKRVVREAPADCTIRLQQDDVLEINYKAHISSMDGVMYDASSTRRTGRPYQMVLGSGDMLPGVDQGLYNMCPGEIGQLEILSVLAYGSKGNKLFCILPNSRLVWQVELVSINTMTKIEDESSF